MKKLTYLTVTAVLLAACGQDITPAPTASKPAATVAATAAVAVQPTNPPAPTAAAAQPTNPPAPIAAPATAAPLAPTAAPSVATTAGTFTAHKGTWNRDKGQPATDPRTAFGTNDPAKPKTTWTAWSEKSGNAFQVFVSRFNGDIFEAVGGSLNLHTTANAEKPSIDLTGPNRSVPWTVWHEASPAFGNKKQVFAARFNSASGLWVPAGQDRGGNEPSVNIHTNVDASNAMVVAGAPDPTKPTEPWVCWQEQSVANPKVTGIFVSRAVRDDKAIGGFKWQPVGLNRGGKDNDPEPNLNVDLVDGLGNSCGIVFAESNNAVPWVSWVENWTGGKPSQIFVARGTVDEKAPGGFKWQFVPNCKGRDDSDKCALNLNPTKSASAPSMVAGTVLAGQATVPWIAWTEIGPTGKTQVFVNRLDQIGRDKFLNVGGSLNADPNKNARDPSITFVGNVPYVAWSEGEGNNERVFVRHLASDPQTGTWALDAPKEGLAVDKTKGAATVSISQAAADKIAIVFRQGDVAKEASQVLGATIQIK